MLGSQAFGIVFQVDEKTVERYKNQLSIDLEDASGEKHHLLPVPAVFIVGSDGIIRFEYVNPSHKIRIGPDLLLAAVKAFLE